MDRLPPIDRNEEPCPCYGARHKARLAAGVRPRLDTTLNESISHRQAPVLDAIPHSPQAARYRQERCGARFKARWRAQAGECTVCCRCRVGSKRSVGYSLSRPLTHALHESTPRRTIRAYKRGGPKVCSRSMQQYENPRAALMRRAHRRTPGPILAARDTYERPGCRQESKKTNGPLDRSILSINHLSLYSNDSNLLAVCFFYLWHAPHFGRAVVCTKSHASRIPRSKNMHSI